MLFAWKGAVLAVPPAGGCVNSPPASTRRITASIDASPLCPYDRTYLSAWYRTCIVALRNDCVGPRTIATTWGLVRLHAQSMSAVQVGTTPFFSDVYECIVRTLGAKEGPLDYVKSIHLFWSLAWRVGVHGDD